MDGKAATAVAGHRVAASPWTVARAWWNLPHPTPILVVLAATAGFAALAPRGVPPAGDLALLLAAMLGSQLAIGAVNEIADIDLDRVAKPGKPIPSGLVSVVEARWLAGIGLVLMGACGARFGLASVLLLILGTGLGLVYDLRLKRTAWSWLPYVLALPLLPVWVWAALGGFDPMLLALYPLGAAATVGVHLAQAAPDAAGDRAAGLDNLVSRLGERGSVLAAIGFAFTAPLVAAAAALLGPIWFGHPEQVVLGALAAAALLAAAGLAYARDPHAGLRFLFPLVASATVLVAVGWLLGAGG